MDKDKPPMTNVIAFPAKIPNADFDATADDVCADRLLTITTRMQDRAQCRMSKAEREAMIDDALAVISLARDNKEIT
jgi:hypothetical protein